MNRNENRSVFGCLLCGLAVLAAGWLISGHLLMIEGLGRHIIWIMPIAAAASLKESRLLAAGTTAVLIIVYIIVGTWIGVNTAHPVRTGHIGNDCCAVYELNPGAMGHTSYKVIRYREIMSCKAFGVKLLAVKVSLSSETCRSLEGVPAFSDR